MPDKYSVKVTAQAKDQLERIVDYISCELKAVQAASSLINSIETAVQSLTVFPERHPLVSEEPWCSKGIRKINVRNFIVYYWVSLEKKIVSIIAVIYGGRNQLRQLENLGD